MFSSVELPFSLFLLWNPGRTSLDVLADLLIALVYVLTAIALLRIVRRHREIPFEGMFIGLAAVTAACGAMHLAEVVSLWHPVHWLGWALRVSAATFSMMTFLVLVRISPDILSHPHKLADRRFRELIEDAPDAIVQLDAKGTIVIANRTVETMFGYTREELLGSGVDLLIPIDLRPAHGRHRESFLDAGVARPMGKGMIDLHARRKDGSEVSVEIDLSPVKTKNGVYVTAMIRDVTDRKRIEGELRRAHTMLQSVLESTTLSVVAVDRRWRIDYMNGSAERLTDAGTDAIGAVLWEALPTLEASRERLERVMTSRQPAQFESYDLPPDLSTRVRAAPWTNGGIAIFFSDISEQKRLERTLEKERALNGQRTEVLARLSSGLAHEIKNPLAIIHGRASDLAEMAEDGDVDRAQIVKACASIVQTSDRAIRILRGVAAMARVETHDPMENADVRTMVEQAVQLVEGRYKLNGIRLDTVFPAGLPPVECREVQIGQILLNLLNNAFDAVDADARSERWVRVVVSIQPSAEHENDIERIQISVIDGGPGVAPEHRERLMQMFFTTKSPGAGIGNSLSHNVRGLRSRCAQCVKSSGMLWKRPRAGTQMDEEAGASHSPLVPK